jgi:hypothetical protein
MNLAARLSLFITFSLGLNAHAVYGPVFSNTERPHAICAIEYFAPHNPGLLDEVCSVVMVSQTQGLTAGHCLPGLPERPHRILCRDGLTAHIIDVHSNPELKLDQLRFNEEHHAYDSALVTLDRPMDIPSLPFAQTRGQTLQIIEDASVCGIFGHGGFREQLRSRGLSTQARILPSQIVFDDELIRIEGFGGLNSGLVEPGDSGGSLACRAPDGTWTHIAQVSGRTMSAVSLFAPTDLLVPSVETPIVAHRAPERKAHWMDIDRQGELDVCLRQHERFLGEKLSEVTLEECQHSLRSQALQRIASGENLQPRLKTYSLVELEQTPDSVQPMMNRPKERYLEHANPFSIVDIMYNRFKITAIEGDTVMGDLTLFGYSESFSCRANIICDGGLFLNVRAKIDDLLFER